MSNTLILNSSNVIGSNNNTYQYNFIGGAFHAKNCVLAVGSLTIPYSWFNITHAYNNQTFTIAFPYGAGLSYSMAITLPPGFYLISDINNYVQLQCYNLGLYLLNAGTPTYYFYIAPNATYYSVEIVLSLIPTTLPVGYTLPASGYWSGTGLPTATKTPTFTLASSGSISPLIGFAAGSYGPSTSTSLSFNSTFIPIGSTVNGLVMRCSLVNNNIATPSDIIDGVPINSTFGSNITYDPSFEKFVKIRDGIYSSMVITFTDQNLNTLYAQDPNMLLTLLIKQIKS